MHQDKDQKADEENARDEDVEAEVSEPPTEINWSCEEDEDNNAAQEPVLCPESSPRQKLAAEALASPVSQEPSELQSSWSPKKAKTADEGTSALPAEVTEDLKEVAEEEEPPASQLPDKPAQMTARQKKREWIQQKYPGLPAGKGGSKATATQPPPAQHAQRGDRRPLPQLGRSRAPPGRRPLSREDWAYRPLPNRKLVKGCSHSLLQEYAQLNQLPDIRSLLPPL